MNKYENLETIQRDIERINIMISILETTEILAGNAYSEPHNALQEAKKELEMYKQNIKNIIEQQA